MVPRRLTARRSVIALLATTALLLSACGSSSKKPASQGSTSPSSASGASQSALTIGLVMPETGSASDTYTGVARAAQARIDVQNAAGGVNGQQIKLLVKDDTSTPTGNATATQELISSNVLGLIQISPFTFESTRIMQQAGLPVVGSGTDGPEWGEQPNTNMFSLESTFWDPKNPQYAIPEGIWKGVTAIGAFGYADSPSSVTAAKGFAFAAEKAGIKVPYLNTSIPFGSVNTGPIALEMKQKAVNGIYMPLDEGTNFSIITAAHQAGVKLKVTISATGYGQDLLDQPTSVQTAQGVYFTVQGAPIELHTSATEAMQKALATYAHFTGVPDYGWYEGWESADLMIKGLELAGKNPTRKAIITDLRKVTSYNAGGILAAPLNFTQFGQAPAESCAYYAILKGNAFTVPNNGKPFCTAKLPNSDQTSS
jgi:branched-chain amino acid transport system substrate-binding protein